MPAEREEEDEGAEDTDGNRRGDDDGRRHALQEDEKGGYGQYPTDEDVHLYEIDGTPDIGPLVVDPIEINLLRLELLLIEPLHHLFHSIRHLKNVGTGLRFHPDGHSLLIIMDHRDQAPLISKTNLGHIGNSDPPLSSRFNDRPFDLLDSIELRHGPDAVASPPHIHAPCRDIHVLSPKDTDQVIDGP